MRKVTIRYRVDKTESQTELIESSSKSSSSKELEDLRNEMIDSLLTLGRNMGFIAKPVNPEISISVDLTRASDDLEWPSIEQMLSDLSSLRSSEK